MPLDLIAIADSLWEARSAKHPIPPLGQRFPGFDATAAYTVQQINAQRRLAAGQRLVGRKIGLTSPAVQAQLGVSEPDYGMLWDVDDASGDPAVAMAELIQPKIEAEIAFVLDRAVISPTPTIEQMAAAVGYAVAAAEIVDSAIADWRISLADTIADNASGARFVLGRHRRKLSEIDLRLGGMELCLNGRQVSVGVGAACLGNPLNAACWLARKMVAVGQPLQAGDVVLTGALGPMVGAKVGDAFTLHVQGFEPLRIAFD